MYSRPSFLCLRFCLWILQKRDDEEEKVEWEEEEVGGVREIWRLDKEHTTDYLNKAHPVLRVRWVRKDWKLGKFGTAESEREVVMHEKVKTDETLFLNRKKGEEEKKEEEVEAHKKGGDVDGEADGEEGGEMGVQSNGTHDKWHPLSPSLLSSAPWFVISTSDIFHRTIKSPWQNDIF